MIKKKIRKKMDLQQTIFLAVFLIGFILTMESIAFFFILSQISISGITNNIAWFYSAVKLIAGIIALGVGISPWVRKK